MPRIRNQRIRLSLANKMKFWFVVPVILGVITACAEVSELHAAPDTERQAYLANMLEQDCGSCHGLKLKGGLGTPLRPEILQERSDETLMETIMGGIPGTPMPAWKGLLSETDARWLIKLLREGAIKSD